MNNTLKSGVLCLDTEKTLICGTLSRKGKPNEHLLRILFCMALLFSNDSIFAYSWQKRKLKYYLN